MPYATTDREFRIKLAEKAVAIPDFIQSEDRRAAFKPHDELVRISDDLRKGRSLKEIAIRAWTYQDGNDLPIFIAARLRTIYRRIQRHAHFAGE